MATLHVALSSPRPELPLTHKSFTVHACVKDPAFVYAWGTLLVIARNNNRNNVCGLLNDTRDWGSC